MDDLVLNRRDENNIMKNGIIQTSDLTGSSINIICIIEYNII